MTSRAALPRSDSASRRVTSSGSTIARCHWASAVPNRGRTNAATAQARGTTNDHGTRARALGQSGPTMIIPSYLVTLWALVFVSCRPTVAQSDPGAFPKFLHRLAFPTKRARWARHIAVSCCKSLDTPVTSLDMRYRQSDGHRQG